MGSLNPVSLIGDVSSSPHHGRGMHEIVYRCNGGGTHNVAIETRLKTILSAVIVNETDGALVVGTHANSTLYPGTRKITFAVANSKAYSARIVGSLIHSVPVASIGADTTVVYNPIDR